LIEHAGYRLSPTLVMQFSHRNKAISSVGVPTAQGAESSNGNVGALCHASMVFEIPMPAAPCVDPRENFIAASFLLERKQRRYLVPSTSSNASSLSLRPQRK